MTCQECERALALEELKPEIERHLAGCPACRAIAGEITANSAALTALAGDDMPAVRFAVLSRIREQSKVRRLARWGWALAAAAAVAMALMIWPRPEAIPPPRVQVAVMPPRMEPPKRLPEAPVRQAPARQAPQARKTAPLTVKMLTADPDVVIYWQVDTKEGFEQ